MNQLVGELTADEDILDLINELEPSRAKKKFRPRFDHFTKWNDSDLMKRFWLSKVAVQFLSNNIAELIRQLLRLEAKNRKYIEIGNLFCFLSTYRQYRTQNVEYEILFAYGRVLIIRVPFLTTQECGVNLKIGITGHI